MHEPQPRSICAKALSNHSVDVGIVLEEDACQSLHASTQGFSLLSKEQHLLGPHQSFSIALEARKIVIYDGAGNTLMRGACIALSFSEQRFPEPALTLEPIVAGRGFHWKKTIRASYTGEFLISAKPGGMQVVNTLPFEDYLACVVVSEMSANAPAEFIKAQTTVARSWAVCFLHDKHPDSDFALCNDDDCQRYQGVTFSNPQSLKEAIATYGEFLFDTHELVMPGYYSKCCGGATEDPLDCFGFQVSDLVSVPDGNKLPCPSQTEQWLSPEQPQLFNCADDHLAARSLLGTVDEPTDYFRWQHTVTKTDLAIYLNERTAVTDASTVMQLEPLRTGASGRVHGLTIGYLDNHGEKHTYVCDNQYTIRSLLHASFLYSSAFVAIDKGDAFLLRGAGWGHGVGLCQIGAVNLATQGVRYLDILAHYFPQACIKRCY